MNKKIIYSWAWVLLIAVILLWFDGSVVEKVTSIQEKKDYIIEIKKVWDFDENILLTKVWKLDSSQEIELISNTNWKINKLFFKEWDYVNLGDNLVSIDDNISNYWINFQKVKSQVEDAKLEYESQKIFLEKDIFDSNKYLEELQLKLDETKKIKENNVNKFQNELSDINYENDTSKSALDLEKLENHILKLELDFDNLKQSNEEQLKSFESVIYNDIKSYNIILNDVFDFWDRIFDISWLYNGNNNNFKNFLWAKNTTKKSELIIKMRKLEFLKNKYSEFKVSLPDLLNTIDKLNIDIVLLDEVLSEMESIFNLSIESVWSLSHWDIKNYLLEINSFQATLEGFRTSFTSQESVIKSFLRTYMQNQLSIQKEIDLMKWDKNIMKKDFLISKKIINLDLNEYLLNLDGEITRLEKEIEKAEYNNKFLLNNYKITLLKLKNNIKSSEIYFSEASKEYSKLIINSPISWFITNLFFDIWDTITDGVKIWKIVWTKDKKIRVSFSEDEIKKIQKDMLVKINDWDNYYTWYIDTLSNIADNNLNYNASIRINEEIYGLWKLFRVNIVIPSKHLVLPISLMEISSESKIAVINTMSWSIIDKKDVMIGKIWWKRVEILSPLKDNLEIITSNIDSFDVDKFNLKIKNNNE